MQLNLLAVLNMAHITPCMSQDVARMLQQLVCVQEMEQYVNEGRVAPVSWQTVGSTLYAFASGTARQCCSLHIDQAHSEYSAHTACTPLHSAQAPAQGARAMQGACTTMCCMRMPAEA